MTRLAERLPVGLIPEEFLVTTVRNLVVYNRCLDVPTFCQAPLTKRVGVKEST